MAEEGNPVIAKYIAGLSTTMKADVNINGFYLWHIGQTRSSQTVDEPEVGSK